MNGPAPMKPTVGRIVHFHLGGSKPPYDPRGNFTFAPEQDTYAAMVAAVDHDGVYVNLTVSDHYGNTFGRTTIPFVQPGDERPAGAWCEWPPIQNAQATKVEQLERKDPPLADPFSRVQEKFQTQSGTITRGDSLVIAAKALQDVSAYLDLKGRYPQAGRSSTELKTALLAIIPLIQAVADTLIGEPPTLNTPVRDPRKFAEAIEMNVAGRNAPDAPPLESRPDKERAALERNTGDIRRIQDAVRHPVIAAAEQLDNDGGSFDPPAPTITDSLPSFADSLHGIAKQSHNFDSVAEGDSDDSLPHLPQD